MARILLLAALFAFVKIQDAVECAKFNACHSEHGKEKVECPTCKKSQIPTEDKLCTTCASKDKVCKHCGLPKKGTKPAGGASTDPKAAMQIIASKDMKDILTTLASDGFEGRKTGTPGIQKAREYIIKHLKEWGAKSLAKDGSFTLPWGSCANIGVVHEGHDPALKNEYVIVGSHYDHIGVGRGGGGDNINNGADDNGSGSTTNMLICKAILKSGIKHKRGIIQLWFSGEEQGLNGSRAYTQNPAIPNNQCVAMLNCDMLGRNPEKPASLFGVGSSPQFKAVVDKAIQIVPGANVNAVMGKGAYFHRSDQANFWNAGIPVMFLFCGEHADYHKPSDQVEKIAFERMENLGRFIFTMMVEFANAAEKPVKDPNYK